MGMRRSAKRLASEGEDAGVGVELEAEGGGDGFAGEVVFGGAEAAGEEDDVSALEGDAGGGGEVRERVADDGFEGDGDAEVVELRGEEEGVGVLPEGREHLGAGSDDFSDHKVLMMRPEGIFAKGVQGGLAKNAVFSCWTEDLSVVSQRPV